MPQLTTGHRIATVFVGVPAPRLQQPAAKQGPVFPSSDREHPQMPQSAMPLGAPGDQVLVVRLGESLHGIPVGAVEAIQPALQVERVAQ